MKNNNNDNDLTKSVNNEDNQTDSLDKMAETEPTASPNDPDTQGSDHPEEDAGSAEDGLKEDQPANNPSAESETFTEEIQPQDPMSESLTYMGMDSTAMTDIAFVEAVDDDDSPLDDWIAKLEKPEGDEKPDKDKAIREGLEIASNLTAEANKVINMAARNYAERAIEIGTVCIFLKELTRGSNEPWGVWAQTNLPFLGKRNRQKFMRLAKRSDCHDYTHLGVDRLDVLCSLTEDSAEEEPIKALFGKYDIPFDETSEVNMTEFRNQIDAAISNERLVKKDLEINFDLVKNAVDAKVNFNSAMIKKIKDIKDCDGNPETYIRNLTITQGSQGSQGSDDPDTDSQKRYQDFNSLSSQLVKTIDYIVKDTDHLDSLDKDIFINLYEKINALLTASGIEIVKKEEE
jgi:hypothetical protein